MLLQADQVPAERGHSQHGGKAGSHLPAPDAIIGGLAWQPAYRVQPGRQRCCRDVRLFQLQHILLQAGHPGLRQMLLQLLHPDQGVRGVFAMLARLILAQLLSQLLPAVPAIASRLLRIQPVQQLRLVHAVRQGLAIHPGRQGLGHGGGFRQR